MQPSELVQIRPFQQHTLHTGGNARTIPIRDRQTKRPPEEGIDPSALPGAKAATPAHRGTNRVFVRKTRAWCRVNQHLMAS